MKVTQDDLNDPNLVKRLAMQMVYIDPRISYFMMKYPTLPKDFLMTFTFQNGAVGEQAQNLLITKSRCDFLVLGLEYTWRRPLFLQDSDFRFTEEVAALTIPYLSLFLQIEGCPQYSLSDDLEPLELVARCTAIQGNYDKFRPFILFDTDTLQGRMRLDRNFADLTESEPMSVYITAHGLLLQCSNYNKLSVEQACTLLEQEFHIQVQRHLLSKEQQDELGI